MISVFSVENVSHKVQLKGDVRGQATQNVGDLVLVLQGMKVNMANFPAKNGTQRLIGRSLRDFHGSS